MTARSADGETNYSNWVESDPTTQMLFLNTEDVGVV